MKTSENKKHSEDYFGEPRNFWWNQDYLELIAKRTGLNQCHKMLDVGCGVGYWSRLLAPFLCEDATMTGIDQEVSWVKKCAETQFARPAHFQVGDAQNLSFANESFDLVTCQTVLMHLKDPKAALTEFHRVLKPGGVLLIAEPNTSGAAAVRSNIDRTLSIQEQLLISELDMTCNRGKELLGQGSNEIGDRIPGYLNELGYIHISVSQNDRAHPMLPPYTAAEEKSLYEQAQDPNFKDYWNWNKSDSRKYFLAANESESRFEILWSHAMRHTEKISAALKNRTFNSAGGLIFYIISATKLKN